MLAVSRCNELGALHLPYLSWDKLPIMKLAFRFTFHTVGVCSNLVQSHRADWKIIILLITLHHAEGGVNKICWSGEKTNAYTRRCICVPITNTSPLLLAPWPCLFFAAHVYVPESVVFWTGSIYSTPFKILCRKSTGSSRLSKINELLNSNNLSLIN